MIDKENVREPSMWSIFIHSYRSQSSADGTTSGGATVLGFLSDGTIRLGGNTNPGIYSGEGTPEGVITARIGSTYHRTDGGAGTPFYVKESGIGNTGWVAK